MQTFADAYRFRHVLLALTAKELKAQYRNMALGFLWALLNPLVMVTVLTLVFVVFFGQSLEHPCRVVVALIPWNFVSYSVAGSTGAILANSSLVRKVRFPRQVLPFAVILTHLAHFAIQSTLIIAVLALFPTPGAVLSPHLLWLPVVLVLQIGLCIGLALLVSALHVAYRDTQYVVQSLLTVLFWASPVIYDPRDRVGFATDDGLSNLARIYFLNPVAGILDSYRCVLFHGTAPSPYALLAALAGTLVIGAIGVRVFFRYEREFADLVR